MNPPPEQTRVPRTCAGPGRSVARIPEVFLAGAMIVLILGSIHFRWCADGLLSREEYAKHLISATLQNRMLAQASSPSEWLVSALTGESQYPPLASWWTGVCFRALGVSEHAAFLSNLCWIFLLLVAVYLSTRRHAGPALATLATLLTGTSSVLVSTTVAYTPDVSLSALAFLGLALLADDPSLSRRGRALAFGVVLGASLLSRYLAVWYFVLPIAWLAGVGLWQAGWPDRLRFLGGLTLLAGYTVGFLHRMYGGRHHPMLEGGEVLVVLGSAVALAVPLWFLSRKCLDAGKDNRLGNLLGSLVVAWAMSVTTYVHIFPALLPLLGPDPMMPPDWSWHHNWEGHVDMARRFMPGFSGLLMIGTLFCWRLRDTRLFALSFLAGAYGVVTSPHPCLDYYAGPLVPLGIVLATRWMGLMPSLLRVPVVGVLLAVGLAQGVAVTGRFPVSDRAGLQAYHRVAPYPLSLEEYRLADAHLRALNEDLARSLPTPSGVALAVETEGSHSSAFDRNALQLMALFQGHPLVWHAMFFRQGRLMVLQPRSEVRAWAIEEAGGKVIGPRSSTPEIPLRAVVLVALPQNLSARKASIEASTRQEWRVDRVLPMPFGHEAWIMGAERTRVVEDRPGSPAEGSSASEPGVEAPRQVLEVLGLPESLLPR